MRVGILNFGGGFRFIVSQSLLPFLYGLSRSLLAHSNGLSLQFSQVVGIVVLDGARRRCLSWKLTVAQSDRDSIVALRLCNYLIRSLQ